MAQIVKDKNIIINELISGKVVALHTETVYGLAASIFCEEAIRNIYRIKKRPLSLPLSVAVKDKKSINTVVKNIPFAAQDLIEKYLPGPLTIILEKQDCVSNLITAGDRYVGVRVPDDGDLLDILSTVGEPIVLTSANIHGKDNCTTAQQVQEQLRDDVGYIFDGGQCNVDIASTIVSFKSSQAEIIRQGVLKIS